MDSVVDPESGVVLTPHTLCSDPAESTRALWVAVADTYDAHALVPLWIWTADLVKQQAREGVADWQIIHVAQIGRGVRFRPGRL